MQETKNNLRDVAAQLPALLLPWYALHKRTLPWRGTRDPYRVCVSEIMLQQTRAAAVIPYYARFLSLFPDVHALATGDTDVLLKAWEGLGYYARARNLRRAAIEVCERFGGVFPADTDALRSLPGIGDYTAGAIASIAFELPAAAVDGNVVRILSRLLAYESICDDKFRHAAADALSAFYPPEGSRGDYTQSFMDLSTSVCLPRAPLCPSCPLSSLCRARAEGKADAYPVRPVKRAKPIVSLTVFVLRRADTVAMRRRPENGLLARLWELPHENGHLDEQTALTFLSNRGLIPEGAFSVRTATHVFTHLIWDMRIYDLCVRGDDPAVVWRDPSGAPLPTAFRKCL